MTAEPAVAVSVLVPIRDERRHLRAVVGAMRAQAPGGGAEFLFLEGGSTDGTAEELRLIAAAEPRVRVVDGTGLNVPARLNLGLRLARADVIARMDAHALFPPDYLATGVRRLARGDVASVSGPQLAAGEGTWSRRIALALRSRLGRGGARFRHLSLDEIELDSGYCGLWRRALLLEHGGWDEGAIGGEDMELAGRIRRAGGRIVCVPAMAARYLPRETLPGLARQYGRYAYRRAAVARGDPGTLRRSHLGPPALLLALAVSVAPGPAGRRARAAVTLYAAVLVAESLRIGRGERPRDVAALPAVFATMHVAWGAGFVLGCAHHGPPWRAVARVLGVSPAPRTRP